MKGRRWVVVTAVAVALSASGAAQAALYDRGGGLIYDSVLNVTWLQDANYAKTSGYDLEGLITWAEATAWVGGLSYYDSVRGQTLTAWRLPTVSPVNGTSFNYDLSDDGSMWEDLGDIVLPAGVTQIQVQAIADDPNGYVIADAVRGPCVRPEQPPVNRMQEEPHTAAGRSMTLRR